MREIILELSEEDSRNYREWLLMREDWYFPFPERYSDLTFSGCKITSGQSEAIPLFTRNILPLTAYLLKKNPTPRTASLCSYSHDEVLLCCFQKCAPRDPLRTPEDISERDGRYLQFCVCPWNEDR